MNLLSNIVLIILFALPQVMNAQDGVALKKEKKIELSVDVFTGITSIVTGPNLTAYSSINTYRYNYIFTLGMGGDIGYALSKKVWLHGSVGYLQRGARFKEIGKAGEQRYSLSYIDLGYYVEAVTGHKARATLLAGLTQSILFSAKEISTGTNANVMSDFKKMDIGFITGPGIVLPLNKNKIRVRILYSYGFRDVFAESHYQDEKGAHNHAFLAQVGYLF